MKLSVETKVAAAIAAASMALTAGAMAQEHTRVQTGAQNNFGTINNPGVDRHMSQQGFNNSLSGRSNAEENRENFSSEQAQREDRQEAREQRLDRPQARRARSQQHQTRRERSQHHQGKS